jgi:hypothetical protein
VAPSYFRQEFLRPKIILVIAKVQKCFESYRLSGLEELLMKPRKQVPDQFLISS